MSPECQRQIAAVLLILGGRGSNLVALHFGNAVDPRPWRYRLLRRDEPALRLGVNCQKLWHPSRPFHIGGAIFILVDPIEGDQPDLVCRGGDLVRGIMELAAGATAKGQMAGLVLLDGLLSAGIGLL